MTEPQPPQPAPPSKVEGGGAPAKDTGLGQGLDAVKAISDFGKTALEGLKGPQRVAVYAVGIVGIVAVFVTVAAASVFVVITVAVAVVVVLVIALLLAGSKSASPAAPMWSCAVPRLPIGNPDLNKLSQLLQHICHEAYDYLKTRGNGLQFESRHVRANVFLADYRDPGEGYAFSLYMPDELRQNMNHPPEWQLRFRPGQGATGTTFVSGSQRVTKRQPDEEGEWEAKFELSDEQKLMVHPDLKWIVSVPIKDRDKGTTLGVMNVDGLTYDFSDELLSQMLTVLLREVAAVSELLAKQPRATLTIQVEEEANK